MSKAIDAAQFFRHAGIKVAGVGKVGIKGYFGGVHFRRRAIAGSVSAQHIKVGFGAGVVHALYKVHIGHCHVVVAGGGGQAGGNDNGVRVGAFNGFISYFEQFGIFGGVHRLIAPLAAQVWFVPNLVGANLPFVTRSQRVDKIGKILVVVRRANFGKVTAGPGGLHANAGQQFQVAVLSLLHHSICIFPVKNTLFRALDLSPGKFLLHPAKSGVLNQAQVAVGYFRPPK
ncbi:MAG: hypothetical protein B6I38_07110 [Anaerolineaceae bacterium 4572_5.1]|nr:MAG: hypothetical protein B6I38_07110 [Anaerolineaceae bacterium 4572_5.1]